MAHTAKVNELAHGLITSISDFHDREPQLKHLRSVVSRGLRNQSHARTNPFDVRAKYEGLVEKFEVLNREDVAVALQARLDELPSKGKWLPEILSLLLQLSDRPVERSRLEDLDNYAEPATPPPELTWNEIVADDLLDEDSIWADIERGYHSSGNEALDDDLDEEPTTSTEATSAGSDSIESLARLQIFQPESKALITFEQGRSETRRSSGATVELFMVRETLLMLHGQHTDTYQSDPLSGHVQSKQYTKLTTASASTVQDAINQLADIGTSLNKLRRWAKDSQSEAYLRTCQASTSETLTSFGRSLAATEQRYTQPKTNAVVSIIDVQTEVERLAKPLLLLSDLVQQNSVPSQESTLAFLDALYEAACIAQMSGDEASLILFATVLSAGLGTYLRSVAAWVMHGSFHAEDGFFFIKEAQVPCSPSNAWHDQYTLRVQQDGSPYAPAFLHHFVDQVFALGKSRAFLGRLSGKPERGNNPGLNTSIPDFASIIRQLHSDSLLPFSHLLHETLQDWLQSISTDCTSTLRTTLLHQCGLLTALNALEYVFLSRDGMAFQAFAETLFERLDSGTGTWKDRFLLTELAHSTVGRDAVVDTGCLCAAVETVEAQRAVSALRALESASLSYTFTWPVQNITREATPETHARSFAFLLQISRAKTYLQVGFFDLRYLRSKCDIDRVSAHLILHQRLLWFVDVLRAHVTNVAHLLGSETRTRMEKASGVDEMAAVYAEYRERLNIRLLVAPTLSPIRDAVTDVLAMCEEFARLWGRLHDSGSRGGSLQASTASDEDGRDGDTEKKAVPHAASRSHLSVEDMSIELGRLVHFVAAGLRGVSRAGGGASLDVLAEQLAWYELV